MSFNLARLPASGFTSMRPPKPDDYRMEAIALAKGGDHPEARRYLKIARMVELSRHRRK